MFKNNGSKCILFVNHVSVYSGAEKQMLIWIRRIIALGHQVILACPGNGYFVSRAEALGIPTITITSNLIKRSINPVDLARYLCRFLSTTIQLIYIIRKHQVDIIHAGSFTAGLNCTLASIITNRPLIWFMQDILKKRFINKLVINLLARVASQIMCPSEAVQTNLIELGARPHKCKVIYTTVDPADLEEIQERKISVREEMGFSPGTIIIGTVGQIARWKGQDIFLKAASIVHEKYPLCQFLVIGDTLFELEDPYKDSLKQYVAKNGLANHVTFTGFRQDVATLMQEIDIFVHASVRADPLPTVLLEALATGSCIVASRIGGVPEIIEDSYNGLLYTPGNIDELAELLINLLASADLRWKLHSGAKLTGQPFDREENISRLMNMYKSVLKVNI